MNLQTIKLTDPDQQSNQGFVLHTFVVQNHQLKLRQNQQQNKRPKDFQPRYLRGHTVLRKEPSQVYESPKTIYSQQREDVGQRLQLRKSRDKPVSLYDYFMRTKDYWLIYNRLGQKHDQDMENEFTSIYVDMNHILQYKSGNYALLKQFTLNQCITNDTLNFDSRFQSGNLMYAFQNRQNNCEYSLLIQNDVNSRGYNQWFYFSITGMQPKKQYRLKIVNFRKKESLFTQGMKPIVFSLQSHKLNKSAWTNSVYNIKYQRTPYCKNSQDKQYLYGLEFTIQTQFQNDYLLISMGMPYSYSKLIQFLSSIQKNIQANQNIYYKREIVGYTLSNNAVPMLTITNKNNINPKRQLGIFARQHPGQTWSSYLMQNIILQIVANTDYSQYLRNNFIFRIFPMVNIDGVIYGNFRCDISGMDLNRQWKFPNNYLHPHLFAIKQKILQLSKKSEFQVFMDLHGHSKKYNSFFYSCQKQYHGCRVLPLILHKFSPSFYLPDCTFGISKQKQNTARAFLFNLIRKDNILTLQLSFYGIKHQDKIEPFQPIHMNQLAISLLKSLYVYFSREKYEEVSRIEIQSQIKTRMKQFIEYDKNNQNDSGSQSDPYADQIDFQVLKGILPVNIQKTIQQVIKTQIQERKMLKPIQIQEKRQPKQKINPQKKKQQKKKIQKQIIITKNQTKKNQQKVSPQRRKTKPKINIKNQSRQGNNVSQRNSNPKSPTLKLNFSHKKSQQQQSQTSKNILKQNSASKISPTRPYRERKFNFITITPQQNQSKLKKFQKLGPQPQSATLQSFRPRREIESANSLNKKNNNQSQDQQLAKRIEQSILPMYHKQVSLFNPGRSPRTIGEGRQINYPMIGTVGNNNLNSFLLREEPKLSIGIRNKQIITYQKYKRKSEKQKPKYLEMSKYLKPPPNGNGSGYSNLSFIN